METNDNERAECLSRLHAGIAKGLDSELAAARADLEFASNAFDAYSVLLQAYREMLNLTPEGKRARLAIDEQIDSEYLFGQLPRALDRAREQISEIARDLTLTTNPDGGNTFRLRLPCADANGSLAGNAEEAQFIDPSRRSA